MRGNILFGIFLFYFSLNAFAMTASRRMDAAQSLLNTFSSGCKSYGPWADTALVHSKGLMSAVQELQAKEECRGLSNALSNAQDLSAEIQKLRGDPLKTQYKQDQETKRLLLLELQSSQDPNYQQALIPLIAQADTHLAQASAAYSQQSPNGRVTDGLTQVSKYLKGLLEDQSLGRCITLYPELGVQIGVQALAVGGSFLTPAAGAATSMVGSLLSGIMTFLRRYAFDQAIYKIETGQMALALTCALETMENTYCSADDRYRLARLNAESYYQQWAPKNFWRGLDLWSNRLPALLKWISKISTGAKPSDPSSADRQNKVWDRLNQLAGIERSVQGQIATTYQLIALSPADSEKIIRRALGTIEDNMGFYLNGPPPSTPVKDVYPTRTHVLYTLVGIPLTPAECTPGSSSGPSCKDEQTIPLPVEGFLGVEKGSQRIFDSVRRLLSSDLHLVIDLDPLGLLAEATQRSTLGKTSPLEVMQDLVLFLDQSEAYLQLDNSKNNKLELALIADTKATLTRVIDSITNAKGTVADGQRLISDLFENLQLIHGVDFIADRLYRHIKWNFNLRIERGDVPKNIRDILMAGGSDAAIAFDFSAQGGLDNLLGDVVNSHVVTQQNLKNFISYYSRGFNKVMKRLRKNAVRANEAPGALKSENYQLLSRLCVLLASTATEWPDHIDPRLCSGMGIKSMYPGFTRKLSFEELKAELDEKVPLNKRICQYRDFLRQSALFGTTYKGR